VCETGENNSTCPNDCPVACNCTAWTGQGCGGAGCASDLYGYTRSCTPSGCSSERVCRTDTRCGGSSDTTPPSVSITYPSAGATVSGTITVSANAVDLESGISWVRIYIDRTNRICEDSSAPYLCSWDTRSYSDGLHEITVWARNGAGGENTSTINVIVRNREACTNECSSLGVRECTDASHYRTCGNYDADSCLEWSSPSSCSSGQTCSGGSCSGGSPPESFVIQPIVLFPSDSSINFIIPLAVTKNMLTIASWYRQQLGGETFSLAPVVVLRGTHPSDWFGPCYSESTRGTCSQIIGRQLEEMGYNLREIGKIKAVFYVAARVGITGGASDFPCTPYSSDCKFGFLTAGSAWIWAYETSDIQKVNRLRGVVAHELGHTFSLPEPYCCPSNCPSDLRCEEAIMYWGYILYPNTYFLDKVYPEVGHGCCPEKNTLRSNVFFK